MYCRRPPQTDADEFTMTKPYRKIELTFRHGREPRITEVPTRMARYQLIPSGFKRMIPGSYSALSPLLRYTDRTEAVSEHGIIPKCPRGGCPPLAEGHINTPLSSLQAPLHLSSPCRVPPYYQLLSPLRFPQNLTLPWHRSMATFV